MPFFSRKKQHFNPPPANASGLCTWSAHAPRSGPSPLPFPRDGHSLTATATAAGEFFLFGGYVDDCSSSDLFVLSTRDFSTALLQTSGEVPTTRAGHGAALIGTTLLIYGANVPTHDLIYLLDLGTSDLLMSSPTRADHSFALQYRESGPTLWSMVTDRAIVTSQPQPWSVLSFSSSVVILARRS